MNKAENGFAVLSGVTVVTVTLSHPQTLPLKLLLFFRHRGLEKLTVPCNEKIVRVQSKI